MQKSIILFEVYKENNINVNNSIEDVTIYDAGDSFVEYFHKSNEWKYWKILDSSYNNGLYARIIEFIDYDIVPSNIISTYNIIYSGNIRGKWEVIRSEQVHHQESLQLPHYSAWICKKKLHSSVKSKLHEKHAQSRKKPDGSQAMQQEFHKHPLKTPPSQQYLQQQSLHQQLLLLQQLQFQLSQQLIPVKQPALLPDPPSLKQTSLVPLVQPGSQITSFPLVSSILLPAR